MTMVKSNEDPSAMEEFDRLFYRLVEAIEEMHRDVLNPSLRTNPQKREEVLAEMTEHLVTAASCLRKLRLHHAPTRDMARE